MYREPRGHTRPSSRKPSPTPRHSRRSSTRRSLPCRSSPACGCPRALRKLLCLPSFARLTTGGKRGVRTDPENSVNVLRSKKHGRVARTQQNHRRQVAYEQEVSGSRVFVHTTLLTIFSNLPGEVQMKRTARASFLLAGAKRPMVPPLDATVQCPMTRSAKMFNGPHAHGWSFRRDATRFHSPRRTTKLRKSCMTRSSVLNII